SASPGSVTGKTSTPTVQTAGTAFNVTVNAVDANWNLVSNATDTVAITLSDSNAVPPASAALAGGTQSFNVVFKTAGAQTVTGTDTSDGSKAANTSSGISVNAG